MKCASGLARAGAASVRGAYRSAVPVRNFGNFLASLRKDRGLTQVEYSALLGVSRRSIITAERLPYFWRTNTVESIARFEGCDLRVLHDTFKRKFWGDK